MNCEEFGIVGLDLDLDASGLDSADAREHLRSCPRCAALFESALALRADLRELSQATSEASSPSRVEMRLRQEFRTRHKTLRTHRVTWLAGWSLAAASIIAGALIWVNWHQGSGVRVAPKKDLAVLTAPSVNSSIEPATGKSPASPALPQAQSMERSRPLMAAKAMASDEFTLLPDSVPGFLEDSTVVRVQLQRGALGAFGLPVSEERATDWIQVDLLVAADGQPQALRLPRSTSN